MHLQTQMKPHFPSHKDLHRTQDYRNFAPILLRCILLHDTPTPL